MKAAMADMKVFNAITGFAVLLLVSCTSIHDEKTGRYHVPRTAEVRSPFGTNITFGKLENCGKVNGEFVDCRTVREWEMVSSQGQGGQVAAGALNAAGLGVLGALMPSTSNSANASQSVTVTAPRSHHR